MTARGPQPPRRLPLLAAVLAVTVVLSLIPLAPALAASPSGGSRAPGATSQLPGASLPIHGAGSDDRAIVTTTDTIAPMTLSAITGPASCTGWTSDSQPPATIRVYRTRTDTVDVVDFRTYARKVVTGEFLRTWPFQVLAVGAILAKQNAWYWAMQGRDWTNLLNWGGQPNPIQKVMLPNGQYQWQTTAASPSGPGQCWDITDNPGIDQCYDCGTTPTDPTTAPRNQAALDATWPISIKRPRAGIESFFAPSYMGSTNATCPSMATQADWETWFTGRLDFTQAVACATAQGESAAMLMRRFLSSALEIHDPGRADLTGDGLGDVPVLRVGGTIGGVQAVALDPATTDPAYLAGAGTVPPPVLTPDPGTTVARAVGRLDRTDRASLVSLSIDQNRTVSIVARSLDAPGVLRQVPWWSGQIPGLDPTGAISLSVADITGDMRPDVLVLERARTVAPDGVTATWSLRLYVLATTDSGADPAGFVKWADLGPFPLPTRFERLGDVDGDGRVDLVFATGDGQPFVVARAMRNGMPALGPVEPYGSLVSPSSQADWRFFALADGNGTGRDEPVVAATGNAAASFGGASAGLALLTATAASDPTTYAFTLTPLAMTWSGPDAALGAGLVWAGDVGGDGRSDLGVVNASVSSGPVLAGTTDSARLVLVQVRDGAPPPSIPVLGPGPLEDVRVVAPGDQSMLPPDSSLTRIVVSAGTLAPAFSRDLTAYTDVLPTTVTSIRVRPFATRTWAHVTVGGATVVSGQLGAPMALRIGLNRIPIVVTDSTSQTTYVLSVVRANKPPAPRITKLTVPLGGLLRVYWAANGNGGSPITGWVVQYRLSGSTTWTTVRIANPLQAGYTISGLKSGKYYQVRVIARNIVGVGTPTAVLTVRTR
ncbi:MAG TPA: fibronectin type III domain-containing protein [Candidatus Limnocylindrales bacterium]